MASKKQDKLKALTGRDRDVYEAGLFMEERRKLEAREERALESASRRISRLYGTEYLKLVCAQRDEVLLVAGLDQVVIDSLRARHAAGAGTDEQAPSVPVELEASDA
jgi:hypothetical protein